MERFQGCICITQGSCQGAGSFNGSAEMIATTSDHLLIKLEEMTARCVPSYGCMGGQVKTFLQRNHHAKKFPILHLGLQDRQHKFHSLAFDVLTGEEREVEVVRFPPSR